MTQREKIARRLRGKVQAELTAASLLAALQALPPAQRDALVAAARQNRPAVIGKLVSDAFAQFVTSAALAEADQLLADGVLDAPEIDRLLG